MPNTPHMGWTYHVGLILSRKLVDLRGLPYLFGCVPRLLWRDAQGIEGSLDLTSAEIRVGRAMDCAIRTDDAMVSRHHSRIFWGGGGYVLEDLQSANGVYFQEQRVQNHMFKHGDAVRCGSLWLRYVDTGQVGASGGGNAAPANPMMQHPGMGAVPASGPTGHVNSVNPAPADRPAGGGAPAVPGAGMAAL